MIEQFLADHDIVVARRTESEQRLLPRTRVRTKRRLDGPDVADTVLVPEHYGYPYHVVYGVRVKLCYWALNPNRPRRYDKTIPLYYPLVVPKSRSMISSFG